MRRRTRFEPIRPSPTIPSCMLTPLSRECGRIANVRERRVTLTSVFCEVGGLRCDAGEQVGPRRHERGGTVGLELRAERVDVDAGLTDPVDHGVTIATVGGPVSYTHLRAHETDSYLVCRLL